MPQFYLKIQVFVKSVSAFESVTFFVKHIQIIFYGYSVAQMFVNVHTTVCKFTTKK